MLFWDLQGGPALENYQPAKSLLAVAVGMELRLGHGSSQALGWGLQRVSTGPSRSGKVREKL